MGKHSNGLTAPIVSGLPGKHRDGTKNWEGLTLEPTRPAPRKLGFGDAETSFAEWDLINRAGTSKKPKPDPVPDEPLIMNPDPQSPDELSPFEYADMLALGDASNANATYVWTRELRSDDK